MSHIFNERNIKVKGTRGISNNNVKEIIPIRNKNGDNLAYAMNFEKGGFAYKLGMG